jgi:hypothetical protein
MVRLRTKATEFSFSLDNIKMDLKYLGSDDVDWFHVTQDRDQWGKGAIVNTIMNLTFPWKYSFRFPNLATVRF